jgi:hypothetical protein
MNMIIGIDFDGTLADTNSVKSRWIKEHLHLDVPPWLCDRTDCVPLIGREAYDTMADDVYGQEATISIPLMKDAEEVLLRLSEFSRVCIMTNRNEVRTKYVHHWLHTNGLFRLIGDVISSVDIPKLNICKKRGIRWLMDDDIRHLDPDIAEGIGLILFKPGIANVEVPAGVICVASWLDVLDLVRPADAER